MWRSTVSDLGRPLICANRYVWDLSNVNAATGSLQAGGPIARVTTIP